MEIKVTTITPPPQPVVLDQEVTMKLTKKEAQTLMRLGNHHMKVAELFPVISDNRYHEEPEREEVSSLFYKIYRSLSDQGLSWRR